MQPRIRRIKRIIKPQINTGKHSIKTKILSRRAPLGMSIFSVSIGVNLWFQKICVLCVFSGSKDNPWKSAPKGSRWDEICGSYLVILPESQKTPQWLLPR